MCGNFPPHYKKLKKVEVKSMKLKLTAIPVVKSERVSKDGNNKYFNLSVAQDGELIEFSTTQAVYESVKLYAETSFIVDITRGEYQGKVYERKAIASILK